MDDYELEPLLEALCAENRAPICYHYVYIDAAGRLACFDLAHGEYEIRSTGKIRSTLFSDASGQA